MTEQTWKIEWNDRLVLGIPEIDADHQRFTWLVNDLNAAIAGRADKAEVLSRLDLLYRDARDHFQHEERLFAQYGYAGHEQHAAIHRQIEDALLRELAIFATSSMSVQWVASGLRIKELLVKHLLEEDIKYRGFLKSNLGIAGASE